MPVLERSELEASPLADLHAIADQVGIEGFKRLRKADLIDRILAAQGGGSSEAADDAGSDGDSDGESAPKRTRRRRLIRPRRGAKRDEEDQQEPEHEPEPQAEVEPRGGTEREADEPDAGEPGAGEPGADDREADEPHDDHREADEPHDDDREADGRPDAGVERADESESGEREPARASARGRRGRTGAAERTAEGVVEVLANGSAFVRVNPPEQSSDDLYISSAQVRRCELVSGDRVSGPVRTPRRSERYASLSRIDTINGAPADEVAAGTRYEDLPADWPAERLALGGGDPTLEAIEWLTPLGRGSRAVITGGRFSGKSEILRRIAEALQSQQELALSVVLIGVRPEEVTHWQEGQLEPAVALSFAASPDAQAQALERTLETARRAAARGGHAVVLVDTLDALQPQAARRALASARNLREGGSLTVIATSADALGGETTVIALDPQAAATGRQPIVDLISSGTLRPELLVGEDGAAAITRARAAALED
ncbi:MAG TPA: Rho termination factor N-terminal domain-containing protein [Solirubrobacteraceae bacterium]|nr:Rho termination factor N-terminal domain-containing protein [Solirubrobacteraceae bacterium]